MIVVILAAVSVGNGILQINGAIVLLLTIATILLRIVLTINLVIVMTIMTMNIDLVNYSYY